MSKVLDFEALRTKAEEAKQKQETNEPLTDEERIALLELTVAMAGMALIELENALASALQKSTGIKVSE